MLSKGFLTLLVEKADMPQEAARAISDCSVEIARSPRLLSALEELLGRQRLPDTGNYLEALTELDCLAESFAVNRFTLHAVFLVCCFERLLPLYIEGGLGVELFFNTAADLACKLRECRELKGVWGVLVAYWYKAFFELKRFGLGRFEYEPIELPFDIEFPDGEPLKRGTTVLKLHIPSSGVSLESSLRLASYRRALEFFKPEFGNGRAVFVCRSWLLFPELCAELPKRSNIVDFYGDFSFIREEITDSFEDAWRVFGASANGPVAALPEDTELRRVLKRRLEAGSPVGLGFGAFRFDGKAPF